MASGPDPGQDRTERAGSILIRAEVLTTHADLPGFLDLAARLSAAAVQDPGTIAHRWFATTDPVRFVVLEEYTHPEAVFAHSPAVRELTTHLATISEVIAVQVHGPLGARLQAWVAAHPHATAHPELGT